MMPSWIEYSPMDHLESVKIADLVEDPTNAREHPDDNIKVIVKSLKEFGQQTPIVIDQQNLIIKGNGTVTAAKALGWEEIRAVRTKLDETKAMAYSLVDNKSSDLAGWDDDQLTVNLEKINELDDIDMSEFGFLDDDSDCEWSEGKDTEYRLSWVKEEWETIKQAATKYCELHPDVSIEEEGIAAVLVWICSEWIEDH